MKKECSVCGGRSPQSASRCDFCGSLFPVELRDGDSSYYEIAHKSKPQHQFNNNPMPQYYQPSPHRPIPMVQQQKQQEQQKKALKIVLICFGIWFAVIFLLLFGVFVEDAIINGSKSGAGNLKSLIYEQVGTEYIEDISEEDKVFRDKVNGQNYIYENDNYYIVSTKSQYYDDNGEYVEDNYNVYINKNAFELLQPKRSYEDNSTLKDNVGTLSVEMHSDYDERGEYLLNADIMDSAIRLDNLEINGFTVEVYLADMTTGASRYIFVFSPKSCSLSYNSERYLVVSYTYRGVPYSDYKDMIGYVDYDLIPV